MAGALTERDFVAKLEQGGFTEIEIHERSPVSVRDLRLYPLFTDELIQLMESLLEPDRLETVATAIVLTARRGEP